MSLSGLFNVIGRQVDSVRVVSQRVSSSSAGGTALKTRVVLDAWSAMTCKAAKANGFACADTYHAFNGPDGLKPIAGDLTASQMNGHPSDKGNEVIARVLSDVGYAPLAQ